jgi:small-conductance mechanosensitive channel/CRP-like cAMP-binding protein
MTPTLLPVFVVAFVTISFIALRPFSTRVKTAFDILCFIVISLLLYQGRTSPFFTVTGALYSATLWMRALTALWWLFGARLVVIGLSFTLNSNKRWREARLFPDLTAAAIYIAAALVVLTSVLSLPIGGVLATSGIVAIVLGLALQNTLADVFAGIAVGIETPFCVGDRILIADKIEGQVVQINWRSIHIQTDSDDIAIIPNSVVAKSELVNRSFPTQRRAASVELSCPKSAKSERVIEALLQATMLCPAILRNPAPTAVLTRIGAKRSFYSISFSVADTEALAAAKGALLNQSRRQLYYGGLFDQPDIAGSRHTHSTLPVGPIPTPELLQDVILFEGLDDDQVAKLASHLELRLLAPGDVLFAQGTSGGTLFIVASGIVEIARQSAQSSVDSLGCVGAGDYLGEISLLTGAPYAATATARTHCRVYALPHDVIAPLLAANAQLFTVFDKLARRGIEALHRNVAVRAADDIATVGQLVLRIRRFFMKPS